MSYQEIIHWALNQGPRTAWDVMSTYADLKISNDYWKCHKISFTYESIPLEIRFFGGLSMLEEIFISQIYNCKSKRGNPIIVDIGANVGFYSLWAGITYKNSKVYAYEPVTKIYTLLEKNINRNGLKNTIRTYNKAVGGQKRNALINLFYASGFSSLKNNHNAMSSELVEVIEFKEVIEDNDLNEINVLKIDTEGSERSILENAGKFIKNVENIVLEYHSNEDKIWILKFLEKNGFDIKTKPGSSIGIIKAKNIDFH